MLKYKDFKNLATGQDNALSKNHRLVTVAYQLRERKATVLLF
jgi:hypothetical protein